MTTKRSKLSRVLLLATLLILVAICITAKLAGPNYLRNKLVTNIQESCPTCQIKIAYLEIHYLTSTVILQGVEFVSDPSTVTTVDFNAPNVIVDIHPISLILGAPAINRLELTKFQIVVADDNAKPPAPGPINYRWVEGLPAFSIDEIKLHEAEFEYMLKTKGKEAKIDVHNIEATITKFGTRKDISPRFVNGDLTAKLEKSGSVKIKLQVDLFEEKNEDQILIDIKEMHLPEMDHFFGIADGVTLEGELHHALTKLNLSEGNLTGSLELYYKDLELKYALTRERGKLENFLSNLISSVAIAKKRPDKPGQPVPVIAINAKRAQNEGLIKFLLRGLKGGAEKIMSRKDLKKKKN